MLYFTLISPFQTLHRITMRCIRLNSTGSNPATPAKAPKA
nr:MAG TPA: hypothetical protein [Caudoviricetes sp.]